MLPSCNQIGPFLLIFNNMGGSHCVRYGVTGDSSSVIAQDKSSKMPFFKSPWRFLMIVLSSSPHPTRGPLYTQLLFFPLVATPFVSLSCFPFLLFCFACFCLCLAFFFSMLSFPLLSSPLQRFPTNNAGARNI